MGRIAVSMPFCSANGRSSGTFKNFERWTVPSNVQARPLALIPNPRRLREAVRDYMGRENARPHFISAAEVSAREFGETGLHSTHAEMDGGLG